MPFSWLYGAIANVRNKLYERGVFNSTSLGVPTISVGNITVGGTGKTPLVAYIADILSSKGERVCILTRGYGRPNPKERVLVSDAKSIFVSPKEAGDEPYELARKLIGKAFVIADADRVSAGMWARQKFGITAFVLDDGFQHQKVKRNLNIVTIDATEPFGNGKTLPFGILREPLSNLRRADLIVITRTNLAHDIKNLKSQISNLDCDCPVILASSKFREPLNIKGLNKSGKLSASLKKETEIELDRNTKILAFCALGNPENFFAQLRIENYEIVSTKRFPDHHFYDQIEIDSLQKTASEFGANTLITTAKDAVKLKGLNFTIPCFVAENDLSFDHEEIIRKMIDAVII
jgi:tetraacyldisaccharide 4'-kinase